jgi:glycine cleavage system aminomethyltransferase T
LGAAETYFAGLETRSRGQVHRKRVQLLFTSGPIPQPGEMLMVEVKEVGAVTRAARIWDPDIVIGMGYVRREATPPAPPRNGPRVAAK